MIILGAGMTGLAAGYASGLPAYEAQDAPGGICASYYVIPGSEKRLHVAPEDREAGRFESGGGHWIFGGDPLVLRFIRDDEIRRRVATILTSFEYEVRKMGRTAYAAHLVGIPQP